MLVKEVMAKNVVTIERNKTVFEACNLYKDHKVGCLIVTDEGKCAGIVTERDLIERTVCSRRDPEKTLVGDVMSSDIIAVHDCDIKTYTTEILIRLLFLLLQLFFLLRFLCDS